MKENPPLTSQPGRTIQHHNLALQSSRTTRQDITTIRQDNPVVRHYNPAGQSSSSAPQSGRTTRRDNPVPQSGVTLKLPSSFSRRPGRGLPLKKSCSPTSRKTVLMGKILHSAQGHAHRRHLRERIAENSFLQRPVKWGGAIPSIFAKSCPDPKYWPRAAMYPWRALCMPWSPNCSPGSSAWV